MSITLKVNGSTVSVESWTFPGGERNVRMQIDDYFFNGDIDVIITCNYKGSDDLVDLILLVNAIRHYFGALVNIKLDMPYFPFARQDRVMVVGEAHALQAVVQIINMLNFDMIFVQDPHSDVLEALFPPGKLHIEPQWEIWTKLKGTAGELNALVSPDAGALKKIFKLAKRLDWPVITATKERSVVTGEITGTTIDSKNLNDYSTLYIVDDICDGGRTFAELATVIFNSGFKGELVLCITHGIFSKGLEPLNRFDKIYCHNNINNVDIYAFNNRKK